MIAEGPMSAASGPAASRPTNPPPIAALVQSENNRRAWRAWNVAPATVHRIVVRSAPAVNTDTHATAYSATAPDVVATPSTARTAAMTSRIDGTTRSPLARATTAP